MKKRNFLLIMLCVALVSISLLIGSLRGGEFSGADDKIEEVINSQNQTYEAWFNHLWEPPSGEIESLLFALQAAIGAGFIGFYIGKKSNVKTNNVSSKIK
ncbi:energy-coupling factor ABC transporter substrate-binding protein [Clostridium bovifaecis]|uniref:Cobalt transport protein CbiN n=1 Tax=Clostridium bovifaecis TaxID=2184719 RepID=A0A6I6F212_9CLOT|nr:energy-coupling factor ABC transporter substrate-binding protein [Clostridium bovifaecis]